MGLGEVVGGLEVEAVVGAGSRPRSPWSNRRGCRRGGLIVLSEAASLTAVDVAIGLLVTGEAEIEGPLHFERRVGERQR